MSNTTGKYSMKASNYRISSAWDDDETASGILSKKFSG